MKKRFCLKKIIECLKRMFVGRQLLASALLFASLLFIFPSGALLNSTRFEQYALTASNIAKDNTLNKDYLSLQITSNESQRMPTGFFEAHELNGIFRGDNFNFSTTVNCDKKQAIAIPELSDEINFSILYANTFSNRVYNDHYRHEYYPLELMFKGDHSVDKDDYSFCYISSSQADIILEKMSLEKNANNYEKLIKTKIDIKYEEMICQYSIANIYLETNSFYDGLKSTMGDFVVTYSKHPESFKQAYNYYLNIYPFQNTFFLKRIASLYNNNDYSIEINTYNLVNSFDESKILDFLTINDSSVYNTLSNIFLLSTFFVYFFSLLFFYLKKITILVEHIFVYPAIGLLIHAIFRIVYFSSKTVYCFSNFSTISFFIMEIVFVMYLLILFLAQRRRNDNAQDID